MVRSLHPTAGAWMGGEGGGGAVAPRFGRGQGQRQRAVGRQLRREHPLVGTMLARWGLRVEGEVRAVGWGLSPERKEAICETHRRLGEEGKLKLKPPRWAVRGSGPGDLTGGGARGSEQVTARRVS